MTQKHVEELAKMLEGINDDTLAKATLNVWAAAINKSISYRAISTDGNLMFSDSDLTTYDDNVKTTAIDASKIAADRVRDVLAAWKDTRTLLSPYDYDTKDGTGVRDYIHVVDLAKGHVKAIEKILNETGCDAYNLGTGNGYSVLDLVNTFMKVNDVNVKYEIKQRRPGDIDACYADPTYAFEKLGWKAEKDINEMCKDAYNFVKKD